MAVGPRRVLRMLTAGRAPGMPERVAMVVPVAGAVATELWPNRRQIDPAVAAMMVASAVQRRRRGAAVARRLSRDVP
jgi:hypothetical protein